MEIILQFLELLSKFGSGLSVTALLGILTVVLTFLIKENQRYQRDTDKRFDEVLSQQEEMKREYQEGFEKIHHALSSQRKAIEGLNQQQEENHQMTLRSIVTNKNLPTEYRLINYDLYKERGGNSWLDKYVEEEFSKDDN